MWMGNDDAFRGAAPGALVLLCSVHCVLTFIKTFDHLIASTCICIMTFARHNRFQRRRVYAEHAEKVVSQIIDVVIIAMIMIILIITGSSRHGNP